jgi:hypothetical protein
VVRRTARHARALGLWTATWLFVLLLAGVLCLGDLTLQWPVLLVPVLWALLTVTRTRGTRPAMRRPDDPPDPSRVQPPERRLPPTQELPWLREVPRNHRGRREP